MYLQPWYIIKILNTFVYNTFTFTLLCNPIVYRGYSRNRPKGGPMDYFMRFSNYFGQYTQVVWEISSRKVIFVVFCVNKY